MTFALLIPTKDRVDLLKRSVNSVLSQSVIPDEIIIINDGSTDGTRDYLDSIRPKISQLIVIHKDKNGGVNSARNLGISVSKSDFIIWLDDDDELLSDSIKVIKQYMTEDFPLDYNVAFFNTFIYTDEGNYSGGFQFKSDKKYYDPSYYETMTKFNLKGDCKPVFRRSLFDDKTYLFPETVNGFESYTINLIARDKKGVRYFNDYSTKINFTNEVVHISHSAPKKNPEPLLTLHRKQLVQHKHFYLENIKILKHKYWTMLKLAVRSNKFLLAFFILFAFFMPTSIIKNSDNLIVGLK